MHMKLSKSSIKSIYIKGDGEFNHSQIKIFVMFNMKVTLTLNNH